jgi:hypothetical protein
LSDCSLFVSKWFNGAQKMFDEFEKKGIEKMVAVKFTLSSNDSEGVVTYASSPGIDPLLETVLWYFSSKMKGPNIQRNFASLDITSLRPDPSKRTPVTSYLFSNRRVGRLVVEPSKWGPRDKRQLFNVNAASKLYLSVSHNVGDEILVEGITHTSRRIEKKGRKVKSRNFKFVAECRGENMLYGFTGSSAYLLSFNELTDFPRVI